MSATQAETLAKHYWGRSAKLRLSALQGISAQQAMDDAAALERKVERFARIAYTYYPCPHCGGNINDGRGHCIPGGFGFVECESDWDSIEVVW